VLDQVERHGGVLLDQKHCDFAFVVDAPDDIHDLVHKHRSEPETRFVQQQQFGLGHERAPDRQHLLFAAGEIASLRAGTLGQTGKPREGPFNKTVDVSAIAMHGGRRQEVFPRRQMCKNPAAFEHVGEPEPHPVRRVKREKILSRESDFSLRHLASLGPQKTADRLQSRALTSAVCPEEGYEAPLGHVDGNALDREKHAVIGHLDIVEAEQHFDCRITCRCS